MNRFNVRKVAVLGAGVMGAQIAAQLVNCKVPVVLFDLPAKEGPKSGIAMRAVENLKKLKPAPLGVVADAALIQTANYEEHLHLLADCDLVIEAIAERMDWKLDLYQKIAPALNPAAIVASNTSGLSITKLSAALPESIRPRFCGIHFFNPPRYMSLVELIPTPTTEPEILDQLESFVTTAVGKGVVRADGHAQLRGQPRRHRRHAGHHPRGPEVRPQLRRGGRPHRQEDGPRQQRHLPHRRRGGPGHDGARHQDAAGQPAGRSVLPQLRHAARAGPLDRTRCAGPEERRRFLQEGRQGHPAPGPGHRRLRGRWRQGRPAGRAHPEEARGRAPEAAARIQQPAGAVPVGHPARQLPLRGRAPARHRRIGARRGLRDALGLRHEAGPVRALAGRRLAAGGAVGAGRHRRRQGAVRRAAAVLGHRRPCGHRRWCAPARRLVERRARALRGAQHAAGLPAPALPRGRAGQRRARRR